MAEIGKTDRCGRMIFDRAKRVTRKLISGENPAAL
jgi:hypothetical protein